jgi:5'-methylthioadenosine phosphorylase
MRVEIGIIGGTGVYDPEFLSGAEEVRVGTPYGAPSDFLTVGELGGRRVAFVPRHGRRHTIRPSDVNSRANIYALKELGVERVLAPSTVGSLREEFRPGDMVFVDQFIDRTAGREGSFYTGPQVCHVSVAEPVCPDLRKLLVEVASGLGGRFHESGTYVCIEGPRFSTRAESRLFRSWGGDVVGMTLVPECVLAREAELCYASIGMVTDYDAWKDHPVNAREVGKVMGENIEKVKKLLKEAVLKIPKTRNCECKNALKNALI